MENHIALNFPERKERNFGLLPGGVLMPTGLFPCRQRVKGKKAGPRARRAVNRWW